MEVILRTWELSIRGNMENFRKVFESLYPLLILKFAKLYEKVLFVAAVLAIVNGQESIARTIVISHLGSEYHAARIDFNLFGFKMEAQEPVYKMMFHVSPFFGDRPSETLLEISGKTLFQCCEAFGSSFLYAELRRILFPVIFDDLAESTTHVKDSHLFNNLVNYSNIPRHDNLVTYRLSHQNELFFDQVAEAEQNDVDKYDNIEFLCCGIFALHCHNVFHGEISLDSFVMTTEKKWKILSEKPSGKRSGFFRTNCQKDLNDVVGLVSQNSRYKALELTSVDSISGLLRRISFEKLSTPIMIPLGHNGKKELSKLLEEEDILRGEFKN
eukprot:TRINITY_DN11966_c0_g1_i1.p1 TRINITY_DN11966_c0_g1~~TRINITY_DN11966_c0_g1_i1.p1  ORF type:complete len:328 (+),score=65.35 TRINITY_DN11966_c0_g1_i1:1282-2265(+)